jgi:hypothetical protein
VYIYTLRLQLVNIASLEKNKEIKRGNIELAIRTLGDKSSLCVCLSSFM